MKDSTFLLIQEHWQYDRQFLDKVNAKFSNVDCITSSPMDENIPRIGRGKGGVAILWKNNFNGKIKKIKCNSKRLCAIEVLQENFRFILINVYMPTDPGPGNHDIPEFKEVLDEITIILLNSNTENFILGGDWNSDISRNSVQSNTFLSFVREQSLSLCLNNNIANVPYTFHNENSTSTLDHFVVSNAFFASMLKYESLFLVDDFSDHIPLKLELSVNVNYNDVVSRAHISSTAWHKCTNNQKQEYVNLLDSLLLQIDIQHEALTCDTVNCMTHKDYINSLYSDIIKFCTLADNVLPKTNNNNSKKTDIVVGWNEYVSDHRKNALFWHQYWLDQGRPSQGQIALIRRRTRAKYHYAIRFVNKERNKIISSNMADAIANNKDRDLWEEAKRIKQTNKTVPNIMDNVTGSDNINSLFTDKYKNLYNSVGFNANELESLCSNINDKINEKHKDFKLDSNYEFLVTVNDVQDAICKLKSDKKEENGVNVNHFKLGSQRLIIVLSLLFNCMLVHGVTPDELNVGIMSPLIKNARKSKQDSENYRSLTIGTCISKIFERVIKNKHNSLFETTDNQFGFKENISTNMCTFAFNETISYYTKNGSTVYALFLDASKAFDRVNYVKLFKKLLNNGMSPITVRLLLNMYLNQKIQVKWNGELSLPFSVTNGVRQGGILSPLFFSIYMDHLLKELKDSGIGCHIGHHYFGALGYADDIVLLCPTKEGLRKLISICERYASDHDILFNGTKSKLLVFGSPSNHVPSIFVNGVEVPVCENAMHLGNFISNNPSESVDYGIGKFNSSFNYFMASFGKCQSSVKNKLFSQYCSSFYGSQIWPLYRSDLRRKICVNWRNALRRIWRIPYNTHCDMLPLLASQSPIDIQLYCRFLKFYRSLTESENSLVRFLSKFCTFKHRSTMSNNFNRILCDLNIEAYELTELSLNNVKELYYKKWLNQVNNQYLVHTNVIKELILMKEGVFHRFFDISQCDLIINSLCTL